MEYNHTIKEIAAEVKKSPQSIQKLRSKNLDFFNLHTKSRGRTLYFDDAAFEWIRDYYCMPTNAAQEQQEPPANQPTQTDAEAMPPDDEGKTTDTPPEDTAKTTADNPNRPEPTQNEALLSLKVKELEGQLEQAKKDIEKLEKELAEQRQLHRALVITLANEQANVRTILEARKPFLARLKAFFTREKTALIVADAKPAEAAGDEEGEE